jgi:hypothetical protein
MCRVADRHNNSVMVDDQHNCRVKWLMNGIPLFVASVYTDDAQAFTRAEVRVMDASGHTTAMRATMARVEREAVKETRKRQKKSAARKAAFKKRVDLEHNCENWMKMNMKELARLVDKFRTFNNTMPWTPTTS